MKDVKMLLGAYYKLTKPGIVRGNAIVATAGFLFASRGSVNFWQLVATVSGLSLIIASACVWNNYLDRNIDKKMKRTKGRALVTGRIPVLHALLFGTTLGAFGTYLLFIYTNLLTTWVALFGFFAYVVVYGIGKRKSIHGTAIGSISGSVPPVVGYVAVTNQLDAAALLLFLVLVTWQMPHFYAIALFRKKDYEKAGIPVLPVIKGNYVTKVEIVLYIITFIGACASLTLLGYTGITYTLVMLLLGLYWLNQAIQGFQAKKDDAWARKLFGISLILLLSFSLMISVDHFLP
jgi:heme o synthase